MSARASVYLRTPQASYLRYVADRDDITISRALAQIIAEHAGALPHPRRPVQKFVQHLNLPVDHLMLLTRLASELGVDRSEVARRLIDRARGVLTLETV
jgi:hypothetical protein